MSVRIKGLVRALKHIRTMLQHGLTLEEVAPFQENVRTLLTQVETICTAHHCSPNDLPTPSRNAYNFLRTLDLNTLPLRDATEDTPQQPVRIKNLVKQGQQLADWMWRKADSLMSSESSRQRILTDLQRHIQQVETICARQNSVPAMLEKPSRQVYSWMCLLAQDEHLQAHLDALLRAQHILEETGYLEGRQIKLYLTHMDSLWRMRQRKNVVTFKCNQGFLYAEDDVWRALLGASLQRRTKSRQEVIASFTEQESFSDVLFALASFVPPPESHMKGHHHDLQESFQRVNETYFDSELKAPLLRWNKVPTTRKFGHYQFSDDTLMLSMTLDTPNVPEFVFDFVMYHELLHKKHGVTVVNGRRVAHTPAFRREERLYPRYQEAEEFLQDLCRQHI